MCGIVVLYDKVGEGRRWSRPEFVRVVDEMLGALRMRGPDEFHRALVGKSLLGHTRLSIIDLDTGSQPIFNETGSVGVVFNGEIYNFRELRNELTNRGHIFSTRSDTEVIVHLYEEEGDGLFSLLNGMFALVVYDSRNDILLAGRDRVGEKPLVYYESTRELVLASEIKALRRFPGVARDIDDVALGLYLNVMYIPAPHSIFKAVRKLPPASFLRVSGGCTEIKRYWRPRIRYASGFRVADFAERFEALFSDAVRRRLIADVPLGVFLSGGIDSSAVAAYAAMNSSGPVKTFTVGFSDDIDERPYARLVAERYHTQHCEILIHDKLEDVFDEVCKYFDEPFGDSSAIPTYMISREARKHVKVILTGDGGDELFLGYPAYVSQRYQRTTRLGSAMAKYWSKVRLRYWGAEGSGNGVPRPASERAKRHWIQTRMIFTDDEVRRLLSKRDWNFREWYEADRWLEFLECDPLAFASEYDLNYYLPGDLLKKVDMASMSASLECRAPFLDHRLIEMSMEIPQSEKIKGDELKRLLKIVLRDYLPPQILERPKMGFGAPVGSWQRNQLRPLVLEYLGPGCRLASVLDYALVDETRSAFYRAGADADYRLPLKLWLLFVLERWLREHAL